ncbi:MAG: hypothetical protein R3C56_05445 [Pirellulaceae bacterium]
MSLLFQWLPLHRQAEIHGEAKKVSHSRIAQLLCASRGSQLGAWISRQSEVVSNRSVLETKWEEMKRQFGEGIDTATEILGRLPRQANSLRILAGRRQATSRPHRIPTNHRRRLGASPPVSLTTFMDLT